MGSFVVWDMSAKADGVWKTVEASDARSAAEQVCGSILRSFGTDNEIQIRVRSLDQPDQPAVFFYGEKRSMAESVKRFDVEPAAKTA